MSSEVDICNLALSHVGDDATVASINPPEGSAQAEHCARFYPIARDSMQEMHAWSFATKRVLLSQLTNTPTWNWSYAYAQPSDAINILALLPQSSSTDDDSQEFETETDGSGTDIILTNEPTASLVYTYIVTDTTKFSPLFTEALALLLASFIAGPVLKGDAGVQMSRARYQDFQEVMARAVTSDANQRRRRPVHTPDWMNARGAKPLTSWNT